MKPGRWTRLIWFVALWAAGVLTVGAVAYLLRLIMGLTHAAPA